MSRWIPSMCSVPEMRAYRVGGLTVALSGPWFTESEQLARFRCPPEGAQVRIEVEVTARPELPNGPPRYRALFTDYYPNGRAVRLEDGRLLFVERDAGENRIKVQFSEYALQYYGDHIALRILDLPRRLLRHGGVFLHAACVAHKGRAIIFTAPSGGGKSTQAELWRKVRGAQIVNGDRTLLRKRDGIWYAFGSPYCGTSGICLNEMYPVQALVLLGKSSRNAVRPAVGREALAALLGGFTYDAWDGEQTRQILSLAEEVMRELPVLRLDCLPDESAVKELEDALWQRS